MDISKQLYEYQVEYLVLQEEIQSVQPKVDALNKLESENKALTLQNKELEAQNKSLSTQLEQAHLNLQKLEKLRASQQSAINKLETSSRGMDVTVSTLASFISNLVDGKIDVEIPGDVRRILSQFSFVENNKAEQQKNKNFMNMFKKHETSPPRVINPNKLMVKSLSTGRITLNNDNIIRTNSLNSKASIDNYDKHHNTHIFSNLQNNMDILSETFENGNSWNNNANISIQVENLENGFHELNKKNVSLPLEKSKNFATKPSPTLSTDSGIETPISPKDPDIHPLSNCDVSFTYSGTRELKNIRTLKHFSRNSSPEFDNK